ncbi:hypothetical protein OGATHE_000422 [Ogataea polymorpha]|uniref:Uncharacterized protein n=1 Tax=Ogataea polymorpha TaxID=460523 RepID=A0A9P8PSZ2_9ASCO|nr:hypothetical protein OGATHE_000422 [Ogataea polymorpha]
MSSLSKSTSKIVLDDLYFMPKVTLNSIWSLATPWLSASSATIRCFIFSTNGSASSFIEGTYSFTNGALSSRDTRARAMPYADRIEEYLWMSTLEIPKLRATAEQFCEPAPPKETKLWFLATKPRDSVISLIELAILTLAICRNPSATSYGVRFFPVSLAICSVSSSNLRVVTSKSSGWSPDGPKMCGNCEITSLPKNKFASVTVRGPPLR